MATSGPPSRSRGYSLIELLVVLAIVAIVVSVSINSFTPKTTKATRAGIQDLKASLQQAREVALANGKSINIHITTSGTIAKLEAFDLNDDGSEKTNAPLMSLTVGGDWGRYATFTTSDPPVPDEGSTPIKGLKPLATLGLGSMDWSKPLQPTVSGVPLLGFSPRGTPEFVDQASHVRTPVVGGTWVGVKGLKINQKGLPYGCVFVTETGLIAAYYKPDALLTDSTNQWQRLE